MIASLGIIVGAMALFVVLSVFSGLREFSLSFSNATDPDLKIQPAAGKSIVLSPNELQALKNYKGIQVFSGVIEERALFFYDGKEQVAQLKGVDPNYSRSNKLNKFLYSGTWLEPESNQVVVGSGISRRLALGLFDYNNVLEVYVPKPGKGLIENPDDAFNAAKLSTSGIFQVSEDVDDKYVFCDFLLAKELLNYKTNQVSYLELKITPNYSEEEVIADLKMLFKNRVVIKNRAQLNDALYKMLNTENIAVYLIFTLVIIIALFNLVGALIMMIIEKKSNLKTLYYLGAELKSLKKIFLFQGNIISIVGGIIGLVLGVLVVYIQQQYELIMITPSLAYPVQFKVENIGIVLATIILLGFLAAKIASSSVSKKLLE
ncbi:Probable ABC-type transport system, permease component [Flavobacterium indicum GPTSA100-9 = DSM 17447]|uniref:Probable ABC-type transport system, permease component n=2 Tax=Flavobacterium TaxID=237 RepID=H8XRN6_FLAIG|nr:Probable ABC-type transport system, permease component [Flavobacterium indicum GPTSA100-9 = DSM 17447]